LKAKRDPLPPGMITSPSRRAHRPPVLAPPTARPSTSVPQALPRSSRKYASPSAPIRKCSRLRRYCGPGSGRYRSFGPEAPPRRRSRWGQGGVRSGSRRSRPTRKGRLRSGSAEARAARRASGVSGIRKAGSADRAGYTDTGPPRRLARPGPVGDRVTAAAASPGACGPNARRISRAENRCQERDKAAG
jgi:hypothetical protein